MSTYPTRDDSVSGPTAQTDIGDSVVGASNETTVITTKGAVPSVTLPRSFLTQPNGAIYAINSSGDLSYRIWNATTPNIPSEAERPGTGDESAARLGLPSRAADQQDGPPLAGSIVPDPAVAGVAFVTPPWMGLSHVGALLLMFVVGTVWPLLEFRWSSYSLGVRSPVVFRRE